MTLESSLLYTREDGSQDFVHDTYKNFFLARWFRNRINDGRLSVEEAYRKYWSYEEDAGLWGLPKNRGWRALLPEWGTILYYLFFFLTQENQQILINTLTENFFSAEKGLRERGYNPFGYDFIHSILLFGTNAENFRHIADKSLKYLSKAAKTADDDTTKLMILNLISNLRYFKVASYLLNELLLSDSFWVQLRIAEYISKMGQISNSLLESTIERHSNSHVLLACAYSLSLINELPQNKESQIINKLRHLDLGPPQRYIIVQGYSYTGEFREYLKMIEAGNMSFSEGITTFIQNNGPVRRKRQRPSIDYVYSVGEEYEMKIGKKYLGIPSLVEIVNTTKDAELICRAVRELERLKAYSELLPIYLRWIKKQNRYKWMEQIKDVETAHQYCKPKGYNPPVKKLLT